MSVFTLACLFALFLGTAFTSLAELSISSVNPLRIKRLAEGGRKTARAVMEIRSRTDLLFGSLLVSNTIINVIIPILFVRILTDLLSKDTTTSTIDTLTVAISSIFITIMEVFAKTLGTARAEKMALFTAIPVLFVIKVTYIPVKVINFIANAMNRIIGVSPKFEETPATMDDLRQVIKSAAESGNVKTEEEMMLRKLSYIGELSAYDIMTPRTDVTLFPEEMTCIDAAKMIKGLQYSRYPVYGTKKDDIVGILHARDLIPCTDAVSPAILHDILRPAFFVPETAPVQEVLNEIRKKHAHMLIVVDEYGNPVGVITLEDVIEEIVGEIWDEFDEERFGVKVKADGTILTHGQTSCRTLEDYGISLDSKAVSIGGYIFEKLGSLPEPGVEVKEPGILIRVESMDRRKITKVSITPVTAVEEGS